MFKPSYMSAPGAFGPEGADAAYGAPTFTERATQYQQNLQATADLVTGVKGLWGTIRGKGQQPTYTQAPVYLPPTTTTTTTGDGTKDEDKKDNTMLYIGGGVALLAVIGLGVLLAKR